MKIYIEQLKQTLSNNLKSPCLVTGDEPLLIQEAQDMIRNAAKEAGFDERESFTIDTQFNWDEFLQNAQSLSLFSTKKRIELNIPADKLTSTINKMLDIYIENRSEDQFLLIVTDKLPQKQQHNHWYKTIEKEGIIVQIWPKTGAYFIKWLQQRFKQANLQVDSDSIQLVAQATEGNLLAASQSIEKLRLIHGSPAQLTREQVNEVVTQSSQYDIFQWMDCCLQGNIKKTITILQQLKASAVQPVLLLWAINRDLMTLGRMAGEIENGQSLQTVFTSEKIWEKRKPLMAATMKRHTKNQIYGLILKAAKIDLIVKGIESGNIWERLLDLSIQLGKGETP